MGCSRVGQGRFCDLAESFHNPVASSVQDRSRGKSVALILPSAEHLKLQRRGFQGTKIYFHSSIETAEWERGEGCSALQQL